MTGWAALVVGSPGGEVAGPALGPFRRLTPLGYGLRLESPGSVPGPGTRPPDGGYALTDRMYPPGGPGALTSLTTAPTSAMIGSLATIAGTTVIGVVLPGLHRLRPNSTNIVQSC